ncbi:MAG: TIGR03960 family B12-binding radical SAM protein [Schwartzia sp.]|nr:TIGR03960 family B12-binding radical SAM protein [Schwartzia sp. (in: firmicutes)]
MINLMPDILSSVEKPARYTGNEFNEIVKKHDKVKCKFALSMPDVYEVGMSNLGLKILYEVLNGKDDVAAERVYAPWVDMEAAMRERDVPLFSLETKTEIKAFDFLGFSLQYEMSYTNVLNMLDLSDIAIHSSERGMEEPFVVGGGPCVYNVEPVADFFDLFVIGEGEIVVAELVEAFIGWKEEGKQGGREGFLRRAAMIEGIYVPSFYEPQYDKNDNFVGISVNMKSKDVARPVIYKRVLKSFDEAPAMTRPIVPNLDIVHNRIMLELFRGCSRGCRFCQAGIEYRPVRERSPRRLNELARKMVDATGYDEMSLTSLSSADYSCLNGLIDELFDEFSDEKVSFSLPSLRIDSFSIELADRMQQVRKSGLTFAPEAGTQRLRDVINKGVTEENLMGAVSAAFKKGWKNVKLYFMIGLPTETDDDIIGIAELAQKVVDLYKEIRHRRDVRVTVSVSCFVPKPYTPFQWFGQNSLEEFTRKQQLIKENIHDRAIHFAYHDARVSLIEGALARGDRRLGAVIERAYRNGAKFDGWSDYFNERAWAESFDECHVDMKKYNERERSFDEALPWSHTTPGVSEAFLRREWEKAMAEELTHDCRRGECTGCGVCQTLGVDVVDFKAKYGERENTIPNPEDKKLFSIGEDKEKNKRMFLKYRAIVTKGESIRYISHLDYADMIIRAVARARLPIAYSEGFNPHMRISFASALAVGVTSRAECMEFELTTKIGENEIFERFRKALPAGIEILSVKYLEGKRKAPMAEVDEAIYDIRLPIIMTDNVEDKIRRSLDSFQCADACIYERVMPKKKREIDVKKYVRDIEYTINDGVLLLEVSITITPTGSVKPGEIIEVLVKEFDLPCDRNMALIERKALLSVGRPLA